VEQKMTSPDADMKQDRDYRFSIVANCNFSVVASDMGEARLQVESLLKTLISKENAPGVYNLSTMVTLMCNLDNGEYDAIPK